MFEDVDEGHPDKKEENGFHYYYNREERLKNAPQIVKDYYAGKMQPVRGIKIFFTKQNRFIFIGLIIFVAFAYIYTAFNKNGNYAKVNELDTQVQAFCYEDQIYASLKISRNPKSKDDTPRKVSADFYFYDVDKQMVYTDTQSLLYESGEVYLRSKYTDFDIIRVDVTVSVDDQTKEVYTSIKR